MIEHYLSRKPGSLMLLDGCVCVFRSVVNVVNRICPIDGGLMETMQTQQLMQLQLMQQMQKMQLAQLAAAEAANSRGGRGRSRGRGGGGGGDEDVDDNDNEAALPGEFPEETAARLAAEKAKAREEEAKFVAGFVSAFDWYEGDRFPLAYLLPPDVAVLMEHMGFNK